MAKILRSVDVLEGLADVHGPSKGGDPVERFTRDRRSAPRHVLEERRMGTPKAQEHIASIDRWKDHRVMVLERGGGGAQMPAPKCRTVRANQDHRLA